MTNPFQKEKGLIDILKSKIVERLSAPQPHQWQQRDFENLSCQIEEKTRVILSVSTLKRIWKNEYQKLPHKNTLNALAEFVGFKDWYDFVCSATIPVKRKRSKLKLKVPKFFYLIFTASVITLILILVLVLQPEPAQSYADAKFTSRKTVSQGVPNTVIFDYDISKYEFDSAFIQQSWDRRRRAKIEKNEHNTTSVYYFPGYHHAKLMINNQVVKEQQVYITTDNWLTMVSNKKNELIPIYIKDNCISDGKIGATISQLTKNNIDLETNDYRVSYSYTNKDVWCDSDNFSFETSIKNSLDEGGITCQNCQILFLGTNGMHMLNFCDSGCIGNINQLFSENFINGKKNDLSKFGCDFNSWKNIKLEIKGKIVTISLENKEIYKTAYEKSIGKIVGLTYIFSGCGAIDFVKLRDLNGDIVYSESFD